MFATLPAPRAGKPAVNATRLGNVLPVPGKGFYNISTDAYMLFEPAASLWHMWITEIPVGSRAAHRNIGHLTVHGTAENMPTTGWTYQTNTVFPELPAWGPFVGYRVCRFGDQTGGWGVISVQ